MNLLKHTFFVTDTETTGLDPVEHRAVEVAGVLVVNGQITMAMTTYLNPGRPIPAVASGVHGLVDADVQDAPTLDETIPFLRGFAFDADAIVAHNAPFDRSILPGMIEKPWLDTLRLARRLYPGFASHQNQALRYELGLRCPEADGMPAHRALADAYVTARLLVHMLVEAEEAGMPGTVPELIDAIEAPMLLTTCGFGKHRGTPWAEVPKDYLQWMTKGMPDMDDDLRFTVRHVLANHYKSGQ